MHNWEHYGRLPAYLLAATLVASCGGGDGDLLTDTNGVSNAKVTLAPTVGGDAVQLTNVGESSFTVKLEGADKKPIANKPVTLSVVGNGISLSSNSLITAADGTLLVTVKGDGAGSIGDTGVIKAVYKDEKGDIAEQQLIYKIMSVSELKTSNALTGCFKQGSTCTSALATLTVSGIGNSTLAQFTLTDKDNKALVEKDVVFKLANANGALTTTKGRTDANGKVEVQISSASTASSNSVSAVYTDANGVETVGTLNFKTIVGNRVSLSANKSELISGGDAVDLTAVVISPTGNVQANVPVSFVLANPSEKGVSIQSTSPVTDANGLAKATLKISNVNGANLANRDDFKVKAIIGTGASEDEVNELSIPVVGTNLALSTEKISVKTNDKITIKGVLKDGTGKSITGSQTVTLVSEGLSGVPASLVISNGQFELKDIVVASTGTTAKIAASALGADQSLSFDISTSSFDVDAPEKIDIDKGGVINFAYSVADGTSTTPINMTVSSTLGNIPSPVILRTDDGGKTFKASVSVTSQFPGESVVRAVFKDLANKEIVANKKISYVSTTPAKLAIQAVSPTLVPNGQTNIIAKVTDANDNPVSGAVVNFKLENPLGSELDNPSVISNDKGEAIVSFKAGSGTTGTEKITVKADVLDEKSGVTKTSSLNLTVGGKAVFISIATGNQIEELTTTTYAVPHQITVTDATGAPVANTEVKISVWPVDYYKGTYVFNTEKKLWIPIYSAECSNEDANQNGFLDLWENNGTGVALSPFDYPKGEETDVEDNKDGKLWPGNPVTLSTSTLTTGADGIAYFNVLYGQSYANWLKVKLTAKAQVQGTESKTDRVFGIPASSGDMGDEKVSPPGGTQSVYGTATVCADPN